MNCSPPLGSPREAGGTDWRTPVRFPLCVGGTLRRGLSIGFVFVKRVALVSIVRKRITQLNPIGYPARPVALAMCSGCSADASTPKPGA